MLADQGAGCRERIVLTDQLHSIRIALFLHQSYVTGDIHACGTQCHAGNRLGDMAGAFAAMLDMVDVIFAETLQSRQYHMGCLIADGAVRGIHDVGSGIADQVQCLQSGFTCQHFFHQVLQLSQSHTAGNAFTAGLGMAHFQERKLQIHRAQSGRAGNDSSL